MNPRLELTPGEMRKFGYQQRVGANLTALAGRRRTGAAYSPAPGTKAYAPLLVKHIPHSHSDLPGRPKVPCTPMPRPANALGNS